MSRSRFWSATWSGSPRPAEVTESTDAAEAAEVAGSADRPSVSWRQRVPRRIAGSVGAAVVLAGVGPAVANAAGADMANPVAFALRASGNGLKAAFGADESAPCVTPTEEPSSEPSVEPTAEPTAEPTTEPTAEPTPEPTAEPTADPTASATETSADPSAGTTVSSADASAGPTDVAVDESASPAPSTEAPAEPDDDCTEAEQSPSASASPESEDADETDGTHGAIVSTVAHCAPHGKDPLLAVEGAPANHGGYVRVAAHGETLTTPWGDFDLSTQAGADALCTALDAARAALPEPTAAAESGHGKGKAKHGQHGAKAGKNHGKHGGSGGEDNDDPDTDDAGTGDTEAGS